MRWKKRKQEVLPGQKQTSLNWYVCDNSDENFFIRKGVELPKSFRKLTVKVKTEAKVWTCRLVERKNSFHFQMYLEVELSVLSILLKVLNL